MKQINETKLIVLTRDDIHTGYKIVQTAHSVADFAEKFPETFKKWKEESNSIICLSVSDEFELEKYYHKFKNETESVIFYEPDVCENTSVCLYGSIEIRNKLKKLKLIGNER